MDTVPCRVHGLTSETGQGLNGRAGLIIRLHPSSPRLGVALFGIPDPKSLKRDNLEVLPPFGGNPRRAAGFGLGIGREHLRATAFNVIALHDDCLPRAGNTAVVCEALSGECVRARGNLLALKLLIKLVLRQAGGGAIQVRPCLPSRATRSIPTTSPVVLPHNLRELA